MSLLTEWGRFHFDSLHCFAAVHIAALSSSCSTDTAPLNNTWGSLFFFFLVNANATSQIVFFIYIFFKSYADQQQNYLSVKVFFSSFLIIPQNPFLLLSSLTAYWRFPARKALHKASSMYSTLVFLQSQLCLCGLAFCPHAEKNDL